MTVSLWRNRDFNILWTGQVVSDLGGRIAGIALPLLVLAETGSPAKAGVVAFAETLPLLVLTLPAGALVDRLDRRKVLVVADVARAVAFGSLVAALAADRFSLGHVLVVAVVDGAGFVFFSVAERSALPLVVPDEQLPAALARNQARDYAALLAGPPVGGVLFGLGRLVPFLANAVSFAVSVASLLLIRSQLQGERTAPRARLAADIREGIGWYLRQPFLRVTSLLVTGSDFTLNALYLVVIVLARERGASAAVVGALFAFIGVGGMLGAAVAPWLAERLPPRVVVIATMWLTAALLPLLALVPGRVSPGIVYGAMFFLHPTWNAVVGAYRLRLTPDALQGRAQSVATLLSLGPVPLAALFAGLMLEETGTTPTVVALAALMGIVALVAATSGAVRRLPT